MLRRGAVMVAFGAPPLVEQPIENGTRPILLLLPTIALFVESGAGSRGDIVGSDWGSNRR